MKINNVKVDILESEILGSLNNRSFRGQSYYSPISCVGDLYDDTELKNARITFNELAELDKFINDMLILRATAIKARGYYDPRNNPLSPIEDYIHSVVNKDMRHIMYELNEVRNEVKEQKNDKR